MIVQKLKEQKLISIMRGISADDAEGIFEVLYDEGIKFVEVTMNTSAALSIINKMRSKYEGKMYIGAGTVLDAETASLAIEAGAQFILTPSLNEQTITAAKRKGIVCISGAMSPTEILTAYEYGADFVKVFPADSLGIDYLKSLKGPLPHIPLIPTGGISHSNAAAYIQAGAAALGIGGTLVKSKQTYSEKDFQELRKSARIFQQINK